MPCRTPPRAGTADLPRTRKAPPSCFIYVSHVDLFRNLRYSVGVFRDIKLSTHILRRGRPPMATPGSPSTIATASSGSTASSCPGATPNCTSSPTLCIMRVQSSKASASMAARSSSLDDHNDRLHQFGEDPRLRDPVQSWTIWPRQRSSWSRPTHRRRLCPADRLARRRADGRLGAAEQDPPRDRLLGLAGLFLAGSCAEGHPPDVGALGPAGAGHRAGRTPRPRAST